MRYKAIWRLRIEGYGIWVESFGWLAREYLCKCQHWKHDRINEGLTVSRNSILQKHLQWGNNYKGWSRTVEVGVDGPYYLCKGQYWKHDRINEGLTVSRKLQGALPVEKQLQGMIPNSWSCKEIRSLARMIRTNNGEGENLNFEQLDRSRSSCLNLNIFTINHGHFISSIFIYHDATTMVSWTVSWMIQDTVLSIESSGSSKAFWVQSRIPPSVIIVGGHRCWGVVFIEHFGSSLSTLRVALSLGLYPQARRQQLVFTIVPTSTLSLLVSISFFEFLISYTYDAAIAAPSYVCSHDVALFSLEPCVSRHVFPLALSALFLPDPSLCNNEPL